MSYLLHLLIYFNIYWLVAISLNLVVGYAGLLTLAQSGYFAIGAYTYTILSLNYQWGFVPAAVAAAILAAVLSPAVSLWTWRLKGDFFVLASLAVQALILSALMNWSSVDAPLGTLRNLTNGSFGINGIPPPRLLGHEVRSLGGVAVLSTAVAGAIAWLAWRMGASPWGRVVTAMRDDELAARGLGKNTRMLKVQVFAVSGGIVAVAGALYAAHVRYIDPTIATLDESILMLSVVVVGGVGNARGPVVGAAILIALPEILRILALPDAVAANLRMCLYGVLLVLMMRYRPQGIAGDYPVE